MALCIAIALKLADLIVLRIYLDADKNWIRLPSLSSTFQERTSQKSIVRAEGAGFTRGNVNFKPEDAVLQFAYWINPSLSSNLL